MKLLQQCLLIGAVAAGLSSCSQEAPWGAGTGEGQIKLNLAALSDVTAAVPAVRAGVEGQIQTPPLSDFYVKVTKSTGEVDTYTLDEFAEKSDFSVGTYKIEAYYGTPESQGPGGESEYDNSYYYGCVEDVKVIEGQTTTIDLQAHLANSVIVIDYTEAFKNYFKAGFSTVLQTAGSMPMEFPVDEGKYNYVIPGNVKVTIKATHQNGKELILTPGSFDVEAKHVYKLRYNIYDGEVGKEQLGIMFDEALTQEEILIDLSDALENTPAPEVRAYGFGETNSVEAQQGTVLGENIGFEVVARGRISAANLTITSPTYRPSFLTQGANGGVVNLIGASAAVQKELEDAGIKALGFFNNPDKFAKVDITGLIANLPEGEHKFSFEIIDAYTQTNEKIEYVVDILSVEMQAEAAADAVYADGKAIIKISYNGQDPTENGNNPFSFTAKGNLTDEKCEILSISKEAPTRAYESQDYYFTISLPEVDVDVVPVKIFFGKSKNEWTTVNVAYSYPAYTVEHDALAKSLRIKFNMADTDPVKIKKYFEKLKVFIGDERVAAKDMSKDADSYIITVPGLSPNTDYKVRTTLESSATPTGFGSEADVKTETELAVPNGDFSQDGTHITYNDLQVGGKWRVTLSDFTTKYNVDYTEPGGGWATVNEKTFYTGSSTRNSWFMVVSTYKDNSDVVLRSVAYDHAGTEPEKSGSFANTKYYCENYPTSIANRSAGELFLGSYSFNGSEARTEGHAFASRPKSLTFGYMYVPYKSDKGLVSLQLIATDGSLLADKTMELAGNNEMTDVTIDMPSFPFGKKAATLKIKFLSSSKESVETKSNSEIDLSKDKKAAGGNLGTNKCNTMSTGSELRVSNLRFTY